MNMIDQFKASLGNLTDKLISWFDAFIVALPNLILAAMIMGFSIFASKFCIALCSKGAFPDSIQ